MSTITLWQVGGSPPSWAVRMMADILGINVELKLVDFANMEQKSLEFRQMNPMGTIPVMKDGDLVVNESHTILMYLLDKYGNETHKGLYPNDRVQKAKVDEILFFDTGVAFIRVKNIALPALFEGEVGINPKVEKEVEDVYDIVEMYLDGRTYIASNEFTLADLSLGCSMLSLNAFIPVSAAKFPRTSAWLDRLRGKPFFQNIAIPGSETLAGFIKQIWEQNKSNK